MRLLNAEYRHEDFAATRESEEAWMEAASKPLSVRWTVRIYVAGRMRSSVIRKAGSGKSGGMPGDGALRSKSN
jgi:hypothetical protein